MSTIFFNNCIKNPQISLWINSRIISQFVSFVISAHSPMSPTCTTELTNTANKRDIFYLSRTSNAHQDRMWSMKAPLASDSLLFRGGWRRTRKLEGTRRKRHPRRRPQSSSYWFIGITEHPAWPDSARPGIACCNVDSEGMEAGLGASQCSWDGFGVPPRPLVIHEAPFEIERHNEALPGIVELSIVWQLLQRIRSFIRFPRVSRPLARPKRGSRSSTDGSFIRSPNCGRRIYEVHIPRRQLSTVSVKRRPVPKCWLSTEVVC